MFLKLKEQKILAVLFLLSMPNAAHLPVSIPAIGFYPALPVYPDVYRIKRTFRMEIIPSGMVINIYYHYQSYGNIYFSYFFLHTFFPPVLFTLGKIFIIHVSCHTEHICYLYFFTRMVPADFKPVYS